MAMTRYDYLIHGKDLYMTGKAAPAPGTSWQQKAIADGYRLTDEFIKAGGKAYKVALFLESGKTVAEWMANEPQRAKNNADFSKLEERVAPTQQAVTMTDNSSPYDVHTKRAAEIFQVPVDKVTDKQRQVGKRDNFHKLYSSPVPLFAKDGKRSPAYNAVTSHLDCLNRQIAATVDAKTITRLMRKMQSLRARHGL